MLERIRRWLQPATPAEYASNVAALLLREGFDPRCLADAGRALEFAPGSRLFELPREMGLSADAAAHAIRLATNLFLVRRLLAEASGWPLRSRQFVVAGCSPREAYFLELLAEAIGRLDANAWVATRR